MMQGNLVQGINSLERRIQDRSKLDPKCREKPNSILKLEQLLNSIFGEGVNDEFFLLALADSGLEEEQAYALTALSLKAMYEKIDLELAKYFIDMAKEKAPPLLRVPILPLIGYIHKYLAFAFSDFERASSEDYFVIYANAFNLLSGCVFDQETLNEIALILYKYKGLTLSIRKDKEHRGDVYIPEIPKCDYFDKWKSLDDKGFIIGEPKGF